MTSFVRIAPWCLLALASCAGRRQDPTPQRPGQAAAQPVARREPLDSTAHAPSPGPEDVPPSSALLTLPQAERYILQLINRDRASQGVAPVQWDDTAARAGRSHAADMARGGFTSHWGSDGSVPEMRYTRAGGTHMVQENAGCFADGKTRELDPEPRFDPTEIERVQAAFFQEKPPKDGHRKNILRPWHTHVGVGLAKAVGSDVVCQAQEFLDVYGSHDALPERAKSGATVRVSGEVQAPAKFVGVALARVNLPRPRTPEDLLRTSTYPIPAPFVTYFPKGFKTPKPVEVSGSSYSIDAPLTDRGQKGLYEVSVWAEVPGTTDFVMISLRTIIVE